MSDARNALLRKLAMAVGTYDRDKDVSLVDTYRAEVLNEAADVAATHDRPEHVLRSMARGETE